MNQAQDLWHMHQFPASCRGSHPLPRQLQNITALISGYEYSLQNNQISKNAIIEFIKKCESSMHFYLDRKEGKGCFWNVLTWTTLYKNENTSDTQAFFLEVATTDKRCLGMCI